MKENVQKGTVSNEENKKHGSGKRRKNGRCSIPGDGRIAGQRMQKDSAAAQLFKTSNENFAELFNHVLPSDAPLRAEELQDEDIKETAYLHVRDGGGTFLVQYRDVVKSAQNGRRFVILGIENQSDIDYAMPFRVLEMDFINYADRYRSFVTGITRSGKAGKAVCMCRTASPAENIWDGS